MKPMMGIKDHCLPMSSEGAGGGVLPKPIYLLPLELPVPLYGADPPPPYEDDAPPPPYDDDAPPPPYEDATPSPKFEPSPVECRIMVGMEMSDNGGNGDE